MDHTIGSAEMQFVSDKFKVDVESIDWDVVHKQWLEYWPGRPLGMGFYEALIHFFHQAGGIAVFKKSEVTRMDKDQTFSVLITNDSLGMRVFDEPKASVKTVRNMVTKYFNFTGAQLDAIMEQLVREGGLAISSDKTSVYSTVIKPNKK